MLETAADVPCSRDYHRQGLLRTSRPLQPEQLDLTLHLLLASLLRHVLSTVQALLGAQAQAAVASLGGEAPARWLRDTAAAADARLFMLFGMPREESVELSSWASSVGAGRPSAAAALPGGTATAAAAGPRAAVLPFRPGDFAWRLGEHALRFCAQLAGSCPEGARWVVCVMPCLSLMLEQSREAANPLRGAYELLLQQLAAQVLNVSHWRVAAPQPMPPPRPVKQQKLQQQQQQLQQESAAVAAGAADQDDDCCSVFNPQQQRRPQPLPQPPAPRHRQRAQHERLAAGKPPLAPHASSQSVHAAAPARPPAVASASNRAQAAAGMRSPPRAAGENAPALESPVLLQRPEQQRPQQQHQQATPDLVGIVLGSELVRSGGKRPPDGTPSGVRRTAASAADSAAGSSAAFEAVLRVKLQVAGKSAPTLLLVKAHMSR